MRWCSATRRCSRAARPPFRFAGTAGCAVRSPWASRRERAVSREELELLEAFSELAAAACRNARAHAGLALAARTDALTGCLNHSAMHDALGREVERCRRKGHALSLVIVDLDEFKQVNERHGHLAGDEVLRRVGESLRESVRAYDLVARYGGDEFAVIAMDADEATAAEVARRAVEAIGRALGTLGSAGRGHGGHRRGGRVADRGLAVRADRSCGPRASPRKAFGPARQRGAGVLAARGRPRGRRLRQRLTASRARPASRAPRSPAGARRPPPARRGPRARPAGSWRAPRRRPARPRARAC